jgi:hypothetical protein
VKRVALRSAASFVILLCAAGCARHVPSSELDALGADVGVTIRLKDGHNVRGRLLSLDGDQVHTELIYRLGVETELRGLGDRRRVVVGGDDVPGEIVGVEREGITTLVRVRRYIRLEEIDEMTFHRSGREASLGPVVSAVLGPIIGALLALTI